MGANGSLSVPNTGTSSLLTYNPTAGGVIQYVKELDASGVTRSSWTLSTTGTTSQIAADVQRTTILLVNNGNARVYINFDTTAPTATTNDWYLDQGDRWDVPVGLCQLPVNFVAAGTGGVVNYVLASYA